MDSVVLFFTFCTCTVLFPGDGIYCLPTRCMRSLRPGQSCKVTKARARRDHVKSLMTSSFLTRATGQLAARSARPSPSHLRPLSALFCRVHQCHAHMVCHSCQRLSSPSSTLPGKTLSIPLSSTLWPKNGASDCSKCLTVWCTILQQCLWQFASILLADSMTAGILFSDAYVLRFHNGFYVF